MREYVFRLLTEDKTPSDVFFTTLASSFSAALRHLEKSHDLRYVSSHYHVLCDSGSQVRFSSYIEDNHNDH